MARKLTKRAQNAQAGLGLQTDCTALYIRVSTDLQAAEGYSLDAQRVKLDAYCTAQGWQSCPDHIYIDAGESAKSTDRPAFRAMLQAAAEGQVTRIVAVKLDRIARNVRDFLALVDDLQALGVDLVLLAESFDTGTPAGRFALTMFAAMAELERSVITDRVMTGKRQKAQGGGYNGSAVPFGYTYEAGEMVTDDAQARTVRSIFVDFLSGSTMAAIARGLNAAAIPTAKGGAWYVSTVRYILRNGAYAGLSQWDGVESDGAIYPAIITPAQYEAAHRRLQALKPGKPARVA